MKSIYIIFLSIACFLVANAMDDDFRLYDYKDKAKIHITIDESSFDF